jgi:hypothetical protein
LPDGASHFFGFSEVEQPERIQAFALELRFGRTKRMLMPIEGKKPAKQAAKKNTKSQRRSA